MPALPGRGCGAVSRFLFWLGVLVVFAAAVTLLRAVLLPFVAGMALAYLLDPPTDRLEKHIGRAAATTAVLAAFIAAVLAALLLFVPLIEQQVVGFAKRLPDLLQAANEGLGALMTAASDRLAPGGESALNEAAAALQGQLADWSVKALRGLYASGVAALNMLGIAVITPVVAWYLLNDWDRLIARIDGLLPRGHAEAIREQAREIDARLAGFVRGQAMVCLLLGSAYAIALQALGLNYGIVVGLAAGLISFVPFIGAAVGLFLSAGFGYLQFGWSVEPLLMTLVFVAGQAVETYFLTPRLVGNRVGLHPVWVMFAVLAGGALFGFLGMLIAVPTAAAVGVLVRFAIDRYLASALFRGGAAGR